MQELPTIEKSLSIAPTSNAAVTTSTLDAREKGPQGRYVRLDDRLGSGAYKDVWRAYDTNEGREVAWNEVKLKRIPPSERKRIKTEVKLLKDIEHKNVIKYYNSWVDREKEQIVFITEIMSHGSLKDYLRSHPMIRWNAVKRWCRQILRGLEFLHSKQIIHRDIKCDNIFINGSTGDVRIGDLGLSTRIAEERVAAKVLASGGTTSTGGGDTQHGGRDQNRPVTSAAMTCLGTPEFMAPELYEESYDEKVDIYALGMTILEMVTGLMPYHECTSTVQIYKKVLNGELPPELQRVFKMNERACALIRSCLGHRTLRPSAAELLTHEFLLPNEHEDFLEVRVKLWPGGSNSINSTAVSPGSAKPGGGARKNRKQKNAVSNEKSPAEPTHTELSDDDDDEDGDEDDCDDSVSVATDRTDETVARIGTAFSGLAHLGNEVQLPSDPNFESSTPAAIVAESTGPGIAVVYLQGQCGKVDAADKINTGSILDGLSSSQPPRDESVPAKAPSHLLQPTREERYAGDSGVLAPGTVLVSESAHLDYTDASSVSVSVPLVVREVPRVPRADESTPYGESSTFLVPSPSSSPRPTPSESPPPPSRSMTTPTSSTSSSASNIAAPVHDPSLGLPLNSLSPSSSRNTGTSGLGLSVSGGGFVLRRVVPSGSTGGFALSASQQFSLPSGLSGAIMSGAHMSSSREGSISVSLVGSGTEGTSPEQQQYQQARSGGAIFKRGVTSFEVKSQRPVVVANLTDHPTLPSSVIFHLRVPLKGLLAEHVDAPGEAVEMTSTSDLGLNSSSTSTAESVSVSDGVSTQREVDVEFEFDLLKDDTRAIAEEMADCEDLSVMHIDVENIVDVVSPLVDAARSFLIAQNAAALSADVAAGISSYSVAEAAVAAVLASDDMKSSLSFRLLRKKTRNPNTSALALAAATTAAAVVQQAALSTADAATPAVGSTKSISDNHSSISQRCTSDTSPKITAAKSLSRVTSPTAAASTVAMIPSSMQLQRGVYSTSDTVAAMTVERESDTDDEDENEDYDWDMDPEYIEICAKYKESVAKTEKDYQHRMANIQSQREKIDENYKKEFDKLVVRKEDLEKQLEIMMEKLKERMNELAAKKIQLMEDASLRGKFTPQIVPTSNTATSISVPSSSLPVVGCDPPGGGEGSWQRVRTVDDIIATDDTALSLSSIATTFKTSLPSGAVPLPDSTSPIADAFSSSLSSKEASGPTVFAATAPTTNTSVPSFTMT